MVGRARWYRGPGVVGWSTENTIGPTGLSVKRVDDMWPTKGLCFLLFFCQGLFGVHIAEGLFKLFGGFPRIPLKLSEVSKAFSTVSA